MVNEKYLVEDLLAEPIYYNDNCYTTTTTIFLFVRSAIPVVWPSLRSTYNTVHCLGERALFSSSFEADFFFFFFLRFLTSNTPIMLYNIRYWWFFFSEGNRGTKHLAHPKIRSRKPCLLMFASFVALDGFYQLLSIQHTADLTLEWTGGSMFHPLSHIYTKTPFCYVESWKQRSESSMRCCCWLTLSKRDTHFEYSFLIDKCPCKMVNTLPSDIFTSSAISCNFNLRSSLRSFFFLVFSGTTAEFGVLNVQHHYCLYNRV